MNFAITYVPSQLMSSRYKLTTCDLCKKWASAQIQIAKHSHFKMVAH